MKNDNWIESDIKFEEIKIGQEYLNWDTKQISTITDLTSNSIEAFNRTDRNNVYLSGQKDADGVIQKTGRRRGIDGKNWYTLQDFNRKFKRLDDKCGLER